MLIAGYGNSKVRGLPANVKLEDLQVTKAEAIPAVTDRNPDVECEFFHTRQVSQPITCLNWVLAWPVPHTLSCGRTCVFCVVMQHDEATCCDP